MGKLESATYFIILIDPLEEEAVGIDLKRNGCGAGAFLRKVERERKKQINKERKIRGKGKLLRGGTTKLLYNKRNQSFST